MNVQILPSAVKDLAEGYAFYEEKEEGLGDYFLDCLKSDIDSLCFYAGIHSKFWRQYYRLLSKRFPFAIFYGIDDDTVLIRAVLDCRRHPSWIRRKLK